MGKEKWRKDAEVVADIYRCNWPFRRIKINEKS